MTEKFLNYGIHAEVREDGELFLNAPAVTLGKSAALDLLEWAHGQYDELAHRALDELTQLGQEIELPVVVEVLPTAEEQAEADQRNDEDYNDGSATALETLGDAHVKPTQAELVALAAPPRDGKGSSTDAWREFAIAATETDESDWAGMSRKDIIATLKNDGVL